MARLSEDDLFNIIKNVYPDLEKSLDFYAPYDCYTKQHNLYIELKCRRTHYPTLLLERLKYDRLREAAQMMQMKPVYVCSTPDGIWKFNLSDLQLKWQIEMLPKTTDFDNTQKISKVVCYLPLTMGKQLPARFNFKRTI